MSEHPDKYSTGTKWSGVTVAECGACFVYHKHLDSIVFRIPEFATASKRFKENLFVTLSEVGSELIELFSKLLRETF